MEEREYTCPGFNKEYVVMASSSGQAADRAATKLKEETGDPRPVKFLAYFFECQLTKPKKPGRKSGMLKEVKK